MKPTMNRVLVGVAVLGTALVSQTAIATFAAAQATRTWVSGVGDDVNPCSRTAPCKTFAGAISKTAAGGEISVLDPGGFGAVTITKSITISGNGAETSILASGVNGINVNDSATASPGSIVVKIKDLEINGAGTTLGINGINFVSGKSLVVDNVDIYGFSQSGVNVLSKGTATIRNTRIDRTAVAVAAVPSTSSIARVTVLDCDLDQNPVGVKSGPNSRVVVRNTSVAYSSTAAFLANGTAAFIIIDDATALGGGSGIRSENDAIIRVRRSTIVHNATGLFFAPGAELISGGDNFVAQNSTNGTFSSTVAPV